MKTTLAVLVLASSAVLVSACKPRPDASEVKAGENLQSEVPAPTTFHFGEYRYLHPYGDGRTTAGRQITAGEWAKVPSNLYSVPYRRGFYVSNHPAYNERYAAANIREADRQAPWLVQIQLDPACLEQAAVGPDVTKMALSEEFLAFVAGAPQYANRDFASSCPVEAIRDQKEGAYSWCHQALEDFIQAKGYRVLYDHLWPGSGFWIIRDRTCISDIVANDDGVLEVFAQVPDLWDMSPYTSGKLRDMQGAGSQGHALLYVLIRALTQSPRWDPDQLKRIRANLHTSDIEEARKALMIITDTALFCQQKGEEATMKKSLKAFVAALADKKNFDPRVIGFTGLVSNLIARELPQSCKGAAEFVAKNPASAFFRKSQTASCQFGDTSCYEWIWANPDKQFMDYLKAFCDRSAKGGVRTRFSTTECPTANRTAGRCASTGNQPGIEHNLYYYNVSVAEASQSCRDYSTTEYRWIAR